MPLHRVYAAAGALAPADKAAIAEGITNVYHTLPPFYVVVVFVDVPNDSMYVGGKPTDGRFVRIVSQHLARDKSDPSITPEVEAQVVADLEEAFTPYVRERGLDWEIHIEWMDREGWRENGIRPPMPYSEAEKLWIKLDRPVLY